MNFSYRPLPRPLRAALLTMNCVLRLSAAGSSADYAVTADSFDAASGIAQSATYQVTHSQASGATGRAASAAYVFDPGYIPQATGLAGVEAAFVFYNHSSWDGDDPAANALDDDAIAPDKTPLRPGAIASFANYTSYSRGLNGIMVDLERLPGVPDAEDFLFRSGNSGSPEAWAPGPAPVSVSFRSGAGVDGSDRVTLVWNDNNLDTVKDPQEAVAQQWIEVTVLATDRTGLPAPYTFWFGNAVGEAGNSSANAVVDTDDEQLALLNPRGAQDPAPLDFPYDYDRDKRVDLADQLLARASASSSLGALRLISVAGTVEPLLAAIRPNQDGSWTIEAHGSPDRQYEVEYAVDLTIPDWRPAGSRVTPDSEGTMRWTVTPIADPPQAFFRVMLANP